MCVLTHIWRLQKAKNVDQCMHICIYQLCVPLCGLRVAHTAALTHSDVLSITRPARHITSSVKMLRVTRSEELFPIGILKDLDFEAACFGHIFLSPQPSSAALAQALQRASRWRAVRVPWWDVQMGHTCVSTYRACCWCASTDRQQFAGRSLLWHPCALGHLCALPAVMEEGWWGLNGFVFPPQKRQAQETPHVDVGAAQQPPVRGSRVIYGSCAVGAAPACVWGAWGAPLHPCPCVRSWLCASVCWCTRGRVQRVLRGRAAYTCARVCFCVPRCVGKGNVCPPQGVCVYRGVRDPRRQNTEELWLCRKPTAAAPNPPCSLPMACISPAVQAGRDSCAW